MSLTTGCHRSFGYLQNLDLAGWNRLGRRQSDPRSVPSNAGVDPRGRGRTTDCSARLAAGGILEFWTSILNLWYSAGCVDGTGHALSE